MSHETYEARELADIQAMARDVAKAHEDYIASRETTKALKLAWDALAEALQRRILENAEEHPLFDAAEAGERAAQLDRESAREMDDDEFDLVTSRPGSNPESDDVEDIPRPRRGRKGT